MLCLPFIFKQTFLCSSKSFSLLKHCKHYLQKCFLFLFFVLLNKNLSKSLIQKSCDLFSSVVYNESMQSSNFLSDMNRISQITFITKSINANVIFLFNFTTILFRDRKFNIYTIKIIKNSLSAFVILSGCIVYGFKCLI